MFFLWLFSLVCFPLLKLLVDVKKNLNLYLRESQRVKKIQVVDVCVDCRVWSEEPGGVRAPPYSVDWNAVIPTINEVTLRTKNCHIYDNSLSIYVKLYET